MSKSGLNVPFWIAMLRGSWDLCQMVIKFIGSRSEYTLSKSQPCSEPEPHLLLKPHLTCHLFLSFQTLED